MDNQSSNNTELVELGQDIVQLDIQVGDEMNMNTSYTSGIGSLSEALPLYTKIIASVAIVIILVVGTIGNTMVTLVICCSRDMRTSTNFFLINLSVADLLSLLIITPTALLEVVYHPEIWLLGETMCYIVPALELTVVHASVLTILAISFERYYAICSPLQANYVCTRARAAYICAFVWIGAALITCPTFLMTHYMEKEIPNQNGEVIAKCIVEAGALWPDLYTITTILIFFLLPFVILLITYWMIAQRLTMDQSELTVKNENHRGRRQVVLMLGTVVFAFFLCLLPFRLLTLFVLVTDAAGTIFDNHTEAFYNVSYLCRIMCYINSAINPILYNIMSTKFRNGFRRLCGRKGKQFIFHRNGTFLTLTTTTSVNLPQSSNNNNTPTTISTSASTSPELTVTLVRKNGVRKVEYGHASLYRYSPHYHSHAGGGGHSHLNPVIISASSSASSQQHNWATCRSSSERATHRDHQTTITWPATATTSHTSSAPIKTQIVLGKASKKAKMYSSISGKRNESML